MFQRSFKGVSRKFQGCFKIVSSVCQGSFKSVSRKFHGSGSFKDVSMVFHDFRECFKEVSRELSGASSKFHVAWHSSQLPEQMEGLFQYKSTAHAQLDSIFL